MRASPTGVSDSRGARRRRGGGRRRWGGGRALAAKRLSASHSRDRRFPGSATAARTCQRSSLKLLRKFPSEGSLRGARASPLPEPPRAPGSLSSWQPPPPDWPGLDSSGVPPALAFPLPSAPPRPIGFSYSCFGQDRVWGVEGGKPPAQPEPGGEGGQSDRGATSRWSLGCGCGVGRRLF